MNFEIGKNNAPGPELNELMLFREEIGKIAEEEKEKDAHFSSGFNVDELTDEDMQIWKKFKAHALSEEEFNIYREHMWAWDEEREPDGDGHGPSSRGMFMGYIANKLMADLLDRYRKEQGHENGR